MLEPVADWEQSEANNEKLRAKKKRKRDSKLLTMNLEHSIEKVIINRIQLKRITSS